MKTLKNRFLSLLLSFALFAAMLPAAKAETYEAPFRVESNGTWYATLNEAIAAATGNDTIWMFKDADLNYNDKYNDYANDKALVTIPAGKNITLALGEGAVSATLYRGENGTGSMIRVNAGASLTVNNLTLDGKCGDFHPDIDLDNLTFTDDYAEFAVVKGTDFSAQTVSGAIISSRGSLAFNGATVKNGATESGTGGGIYMEKSFAGQNISFEAYQSTFDHCLAPGGGAVCIYDYIDDKENPINIECTNCNFTNNFAFSGNGGGLFINGNITWDHCTFENNTCSGLPGSGEPMTGGAAHVQTISTVTATDCTFKNNISGNDGCAVHLEGDVNSSFTSCKFIENKGLSPKQSVGVLNTNPGTACPTNTHEITDCNFTGNQCSAFGDHGGATNCTYIINNTNFINGNPNLYSNIMTIRSGKWEFSGCEFTGNYGSISLVYSDVEKPGISASCDFVSCTFDGNKSSGNTGLIRIQNDVFGNVGGFNVTAKDCSFTNNTYKFGIVCAYEYANVVLDNCELSNNTSDSTAAAIIAGYPPTSTTFAAETVTFKMNGCTLSENRTEKEGARAGRTVFVANGAKLEMNGCKLTNNTASSLVSIYDNDATTLTLNGCELSGNTTNVAGGVQVRAGTLVIDKNTKITNNSAQTKNGGAISVTGGTANLVSCEITGNSAALAGGGISAVGSDTATPTVTIGENAKIYNNHAGEAGDDISVTGATLNLASVPAGLKLDDCGHSIDGWYDDSLDARWNTEDLTKAVHAEAVAPGTYTTPLSVKAAHPALPAASMTYSTTFSYTEPWSLLFGAALKLEGQLIDTAEYTNYGAYILKTETAEPIDADMLTTQYMIENGTNYSKEVGQWEDNYVFNGTKRIRLTYDEQLYSSELDLHIYVMFYIEYDGQTYYGTIKDRQEKAILESISQSGSAGNTSFSKEEEINLVNAILGLYYATQAYRNSIS